VGDVIAGVCFAPFWLRLPGPGRQPNEPFLAQFFWKQGYHPSFRGFDWLSSISGATIMAQQPKMG